MTVISSPKGKNTQRHVSKNTLDDSNDGGTFQVNDTAGRATSTNIAFYSNDNDDDDASNNNNNRNNMATTTTSATETLATLMTKVTKLQHQLHEVLIRDEEDLMDRLRTKVDALEAELEQQQQQQHGRLARCQNTLMACQERIQNYAMRQALHPNEQNKEVSHEANVNVKVPVRNEVDSGSNDNDDDDDDATEADDNFDASGSVLPFGKIKRNGTFVPQPPQFNPSPSSNAFDVADDQSVGAASLASNSVASLANDSLASSTFGDDRQFVRSKTLSDKHGDQGKYWGVILKSSGLPHGMGRIAYDGGWSYDGSWCHGWWHGRGIAHFVEGDSYAGEYRFNQRHGHGCYRWADGRVYDGEFNNEHRHGQGTYTFPDGDCYRGEFKNGQREGHGTNTFSDGGFYTGSWVTGRHEGFGECHWQDGRVYKGEWRAGLQHGRGVETDADGRVRHDGMWLEGEPVRISSETEARP